MQSFVVSVFLFASCASAPVTERRQFNFIPDSQMNALGEQAYQEILSKEKISQNKSAEIRGSFHLRLKFSNAYFGKSMK